MHTFVPKHGLINEAPGLFGHSQERREMCPALAVL